jgi:hypothetical protein
VLNHYTIVDTEGLFSQMNEPYQQGGEAQLVKIELAPATVRGGQAAVPMDPHLDIAQE